MKIGAVLVAAGRGERAGGQVPKQWQDLAGRRVIDWAVDRFTQHPAIAKTVVVVAPGHEAALRDHPASDQLQMVTGSHRRDLSVRAGLEALAGSGLTHVLIHDAARPCLSRALLDQIITALDHHDAVAPGLPLAEALWSVAADQSIQATPSRAGLWRAQTPQAFRLTAILAAHRAYDGPAADDVEIARAHGMSVHALPGEDANLKITFPEDFTRAANWLRPQQEVPTMRIGNGYDVHRFGDGEAVILCGVRIPHERGLQGHSDADVGMHALTDAIYGALAEGDIGQHFPPSEAEWRGADSAIFLRHAMERVRARGLALANADVTLICERPKIGPHAPAMRAALANIMGVEIGQISVKATTSERLGFTGREEGIAAQASVLLVAA